ncbi:hypothetical protein ACFPYI_18855 [Halomarina salina]|uniref:DUF8163 domain-containing protein n=1 Tax=Halomarina salina TaxID=1872699 RepID=A0ABD5RSV1_9EURY|nr:hypothetical protein [Halomarina salina]
MVASLGGFAVAGGLALSGDFLALGAMPVAIIAAVTLATPVALTVCVLLVGLFAPSSTLTLLVTGGGLALIAVAGLDSTGRPLLGVLVFSVVTGVIAGLAYGAWMNWPPWLATLATVTAIAVLGYGAHRYERVMLGLVTDSGEREEPS